MRRLSFSGTARLCGCLLVLCLTLGVPALAYSGEYVFDTAATLSDAQAQALENQAASIAETYNFGVYLVTMDSFDEYGYDDPYYFAVALYDEWGFGLGDGHDGEMLFMSMSDRQYALVYHGYGDIAFTERGRDLLESDMLRRFRDDDWAGGFGEYMDWSGRLLAEAAGGEPLGWDEYGDYHPDDGEYYDYRPGDGERYDYHGYDDKPGLFALIITLGIPALIAGLICGGLSRQLTTARHASRAWGYAVPHSLRLREKSDRFTHATESRVKVESDHDSGGGGGGSVHHSGGGYSGRSGSF